MAHPYDALYFREIMGRMLARDSNESFAQAFLVSPISPDMDRKTRDEMVEMTRRHIWHTVETGEAFYTSPEITHLLQEYGQALVKPPVKLYHFMADDFPTPIGFVYFDGNIEIPTAYSPATGIPENAIDRLRAVAWAQFVRDAGSGAEVRGKLVYTFVDRQDSRMPDFVTPWITRHWIPMHYGVRYEPGQVHVDQTDDSMKFFSDDEDLSPEEAARMRARQEASIEIVVRLMYVWTQFLHTEVISTPRTEVPSNHVKMLKKSNRPVPPFRTVVLRRAVSISENLQLGEPLQYTKRWKVRAHWRNQRVGPGRQMVRPTPVMEYIKGPAWAPLDDRDTVQAVVR